MYIPIEVVGRSNKINPVGENFNYSISRFHFHPAELIYLKFQPL